MRKALLAIIRCPETLERLNLYSFEVDGDNIIEGVLIGEFSKYVYPVIKGVPVMLSNAVDPDFADRHKDELDDIKKELGNIKIGSANFKDEWSFSREWEQHLNDDVKRTWGWDVEERGQMFFMETDVTPEWCPEKLILDAGCGNGHLSEHISTFGATVIGLDYSTSVFLAEKARKSELVHFLQGDLGKPPFTRETFDLIFSSGVLHHTPNPENTFKKVAELVKEGGKFYTWLYKRSEIYWRNFLMVPLYDVARFLVSRLPNSLQKPIVHMYATLLLIKHMRSGRRYSEFVTSVYDLLTPMHRYYHTPSEVACWFFEAGYSAPTLTHWNNPLWFRDDRYKKNYDNNAGGFFRYQQI